MTSAAIYHLLMFTKFLRVKFQIFDMNNNLTCITCQVRFNDAELHRVHFKGVYSYLLDLLSTFTAEQKHQPLFKTWYMPGTQQQTKAHERTFIEECSMQGEFQLFIT